MSRPVVGTKEDAWNDWDAAIWRAEALGWNLTAWTAALLNGHWERYAATFGRIDREMWGPTLALGRAGRVTEAVKVAARWDAALVATGVLDFLTDLENEGRTNARLADCVAGWRHAIEGARDAMAEACAGLIAASLVGVGGSPRPGPDSEGRLKKLRH